MIPFIDLEYTAEEDEAWGLFLGKFEIAEIQTAQKSTEIDTEKETYKNGIFSNRD